MSHLRRNAQRTLLFCAVAVLLLCAPVASFAQTPAAGPRPAITVSGTVRNPAGNPVADASVFFEEKATGASVDTKTKADGTFAFLTLRPGAYTVRAQKAGMRAPASASLLLSPGERKQIDLVLESAPAKKSSSPNSKKSASPSAAAKFVDKPSFTVASFTDRTDTGDRGSDTNSSPASAHVPVEHKTQHIIFVMTDGLRWQEVFDGAEASLMNKENGNVTDEAAIKKSYWRDGPEARREALMPFLWTVIAKQGQIFGNRDKGSDAFVTNGLFFSYPGYSETLCGFADPRIKSNDKIPNPNVTVLEWLKNRPSFQGEIGAFGAWDVIASVFNPQRSKLTANAGWDAFTGMTTTPKLELLNVFKAETPRVWPDEPFDTIPFHTAMEYLKEKKPRILYLSLGETDDWAHAGRYVDYLDAAHRADAYVQAFWEQAQSMPEYRGNTTLIFSPDHGRGKAPHKWKDHGQKIPDSKYIWIAFLGPDTPAMGERSNIPPVTQNEIAATLAAFLGEDYAADVPKAGKAIPDVLPH
jgi:hypothetical protein